MSIRFHVPPFFCAVQPLSMTIGKLARAQIGKDVAMGMPMQIELDLRIALEDGAQRISAVQCFFIILVKKRKVVEHDDFLVRRKIGKRMLEVRLNLFGKDTVGGKKRSGLGESKRSATILFPGLSRNFDPCHKRIRFVPHEGT